MVLKTETMRSGLIFLNVANHVKEDREAAVALVPIRHQGTVEKTAMSWDQM